MPASVAIPAVRQKRSKLAPTCCQASSTIAAGTIPASVVDFSMALLSFADSAPRAYWLKAGNAYLTFSTSTGTCPEFVAWWIDQETGLPIPERAGVLRYYVRVAEKTVWADRPEELIDQMIRRQDMPPGADPLRPISVTFIPAKVHDNPALLRVNPEYLTWLLSLPLLERERLLGGNWKIRPAAGLYFKQAWCGAVEQVPADLELVRYWDLAATEKTELNDPDWTVGIKLGRDRSGRYWLLDMGA